MKIPQCEVALSSEFETGAPYTTRVHSDSSQVDEIKWMS